MPDDILSTWSTPWMAPLSPPFPFTYHDIEVLTLTWKTDPVAAAAFLPPPLRLRSPWVLAHVYNMKDVEHVGAYGECNIMLDAEIPGGAAGGYSPFLFLNIDAGIAQGREVHGQPKKFGNARIEYRQDLIVGLLERNGIDVLTGTTFFKRQKGSIDELKKRTFDFALNINYKVLQHIDGTCAVRQLTSRRLADVTVKECYTAPCSVELRKNVQAPLYKLPVLEEGDAWWWRAGFTLVPGVILHDYLKDKA